MQAPGLGPGDANNEQASHEPSIKLEPVRRLAIGGMGELMLAKRVDAAAHGQRVVVKRLKPDADATHLRLFEREAAALARVDSPYVTRLIARAGGDLIIEYVDGVDLARLLASRRKRGRPLPERVAWAIVHAVGLGTCDLHAADIVHRDINPANVLIGRTGTVKLADLGIAGDLTKQATTIAGVKGTLAYMAPEQLAGGPTTAQTDIYAVGLLAYEVLAGEVAGAGASAAQGLQGLVAARQTLPAPPSRHRPELTADVDAWILHALEPLPARRPASMQQWLAACPVADSADADRELAQLVARLTPQPAPSKTFVAAAPPALDTTAAAVPLSTPTRRWPWAIAALAAALAVVATVALSGPAGQPAVVRLSAHRLGPTPTLAPTPSLVPASRPVAERATKHAPARVNAPPPVSAPNPRPDTNVVTRVPARIQPRDPEPIRRPKPTSAPARTLHPTRPKPAADPQAFALRITTGGSGPIHVRGGGTKGLAPQTTAPLSAGQSQLVTLTGGGDPFKARVRVTRGDNALYVNIAAPPGAVYAIRCGARPSAAAIVKLPISQPTRCLVTDAQGRSMAFGLQQVANP